MREKREEKIKSKKGRSEAKIKERGQITQHKVMLKHESKKEKNMSLHSKNKGRGHYMVKHNYKCALQRSFQGLPIKID